LGAVRTYKEGSVRIHDWSCSYGNSSDQILTSYTTCSNGAQWSVSLIHPVKPTSDVNANVTAVAKSPKHISEPRFFRQSLHDRLHRILVTVNVPLSGADHEGACFRRSRTFAAFMPHWGEWSASLSGRFTHLLNTPPGKIFSTPAKGVGGPQRRSRRFGESKTFLCLCRESFPESSNPAGFLCTLILNFWLCSQQLVYLIIVIRKSP
jgi:hypothetical protein